MRGLSTPLSRLWSMMLNGKGPACSYLPHLHLLVSLFFSSLPPSLPPDSIFSCLSTLPRPAGTLFECPSQDPAAGAVLPRHLSLHTPPPPLPPKSSPVVLSARIRRLPLHCEPAFAFWKIMPRLHTSTTFSPIGCNVCGVALRLKHRSIVPDCCLALRST